MESGLSKGVQCQSKANKLWKSYQYLNKYKGIYKDHRTHFVRVLPREDETPSEYCMWPGVHPRNSSSPAFKVCGFFKIMASWTKKTAGSRNKSPSVFQAARINRWMVFMPSTFNLKTSVKWWKPLSSLFKHITEAVLTLLLRKAMRFSGDDSIILCAVSLGPFASPAWYSSTHLKNWNRLRHSKNQHFKGLFILFRTTIGI